MLRRMNAFKAYDLRGVYGRDFDADTVYRIGRVLPGFLDAPAVLVGRDPRASSPEIHDALCRGITESGADVDDLGICTTPTTYFFTGERGYRSAVMITASHNPAEYNGLKFSRAGALPVGYDSGLREIEAAIARPLPPPAARPGAVRPVAWKEDYLAFFRRRLPDLSALRFGVDTSNGSAGLLVRDLYGDRALYLNETLDGTFPNHSPNPLEPDASRQLRELVAREKLDLGVIFDGDADRCMFVDERGEFVQPDFLIPLLAETFAERAPVIHDVRTSRAAIERLAAAGFTPIMGKVGHAFAKVLLRETKAVCGGELAGHYYFRDFHFCDSGELAALRLLSAFAAAKAAGQSVSAVLAPVTRKYANSGEVNFKVEDKPAAIARVLATAAQLSRETGRSEIDGYRLEYAEGWISVRQSNTEPYLRLIVECDTPERLTQWQGALSAAIA